MYIKMYFKSEEDSFCSDLECFLIDAEHEGLKEIELVEAIPDNGNNDIVWCTYHGATEEKDLCRKAHCSYYSSKSGRGKCEHKGNLYLHGNKVKFKIE